ncbi:MAG: hypothetical protein H8E38_12500 [SAR324 cluster bacterium]|nr:hypothetical protein [SAR324 cluster bacterium]MBL7036003.1 hypothetical protein [SAR324 cluster bacterium]
MQNHSSLSENYAEEIYQDMLRETFGIPENNDADQTDEFADTVSFKNTRIDSEVADNFLVQKLINSLTAQLQAIIPGAFRIIAKPIQCLSYANLHSWSPGRSYFSLFELTGSSSVWILHLSRSVGEGLASLLHTESTNKNTSIFMNLAETDSMVYLEIGGLLRKLFDSILALWPKSDNLKVTRCRHILQLGFLPSSNQNEDYLILPFYLDNRVCSGDFHLIIPQRFLLESTDY